MGTREENKTKAEQWTAKMEKEHAGSIKESIAGSTIYGEDNIDIYKIYENYNKDRNIIVEDIDSVSAVIKYATENPDKKIAVLNFASYKNPGGGFIVGSMAQEEALCHSSDLYNILKEFEREYYFPHRRDTNKAMYRHTAIYTPNVLFFDNADETKSVKCDVITCSAPNFKAGREHYHTTPAWNNITLEDRVRFLKVILEEQKVDIAILGAWGAGVFQQNPNTVAKYFNKIFANSSISNIIYAVPSSINNENYEAFKTNIEEKRDG